LFPKHIHPTAFILSIFFTVVGSFGGQTKKQIGEITIEGANTFTISELLRVAGITPKQHLSPGTDESIVNRIKRAYRERGFVQANVSLSQESDAPKSSGMKTVVNIKIAIDEGAAYHIRRTEVMGNETTNHNVVMRAAGLRPGEPYDPDRIARWVEGLSRLGRFYPVKREDIEIQVNDDEYFADVLFHLKEKPGLKGRRH